MTKLLFFIDNCKVIEKRVRNQSEKKKVGRVVSRLPFTTLIAQTFVWKVTM